MCINLELKHQCPDFAAIRRVLRGLGAERVGVFRQHDTFFHLPENGLGAKAKGAGAPARMKLRVMKDRSELIYYVRPDFSATARSTDSVLLVYPVTDKKLLPLLSLALGVKSVVIKSRELWKKGDTVFHLDTVEGKGKIFEIEVRKKGKATARDREKFDRYKAAVLPHLGPVITGSNGD
ncbi:MAG TPA: class IV adenylate cyclase [Candidatus Paceibacterota bacterium]|nr:class IV adenylate cyclase [Candidatus Paceibacterota bacterium]